MRNNYHRITGKDFGASELYCAVATLYSFEKPIAKCNIKLDLHFRFFTFVHVRKMVSSLYIHPENYLLH